MFRRGKDGSDWSDGGAGSGTEAWPGVETSGSDITLWGQSEGLERSSPIEVVCRGRGLDALVLAGLLRPDQDYFGSFC